MEENINTNFLENTMDKNLEHERSLIRKEPHAYIMNWAESKLKHVGARVFKLLALQPCSLILPDLVAGSERTNINILYLSNPSGGKTKCCRYYENALGYDSNEKTSYNPYSIKESTAAGFQKTLAEMGSFSLIIDDFSNCMARADSDAIVKVLEGITDDEQKISKATSSYAIDVKVRAISLICGTWHDLVKYMSKFESGLFSRFVFLFIDFNERQRQEIARFRNDRIGTKNSMDIDIRDEVIREYYDELYSLQQKKTITGYDIPVEFKNKLLKEWNKSTERIKSELMTLMGRPTSIEFNREQTDAYKFLVSSAFLNFYNRKVESGRLIPNEQDLEVALDLLKQNLSYKSEILKIHALNGNRQAIISLMNSSTVPPRIKEFLSNFGYA